ncbi:hypothetical protein EZS27_011357 [termite gut metagenome]|uniref:Conjugative transposon protein TraM n=1 Tax=termite gut metagenome TaxID=433724 RepID=A0A5J4S4Y0_9ZZZZ
MNNNKHMRGNKQENETKPTLTNEQKQVMKKYAVFALMFTIFAAVMWLIFSPSEQDKAKAEGDFLPDTVE